MMESALSNLQRKNKYVADSIPAPQASDVGNTLTAPVRSLKRGCVLKYWEIIADNLSKAGWSWGYVSAIDYNGRTFWIADAHRDDGKRFVVHADEKLTAFT
jgi:hypothetical protein